MGPEQVRTEYLTSYCTCRGAAEKGQYMVGALILPIAPGFLPCIAAGRRVRSASIVLISVAVFEKIVRKGIKSLCAAYIVLNERGSQRYHMTVQCRLSNVTKDYLAMFHDILDNMIQGMTEAELTSSISYNFIVQMIPHHQAAIDMSRNILHYTTNIALQDIALDIVGEQTRSIESMRRIESCCSRLMNTEREVCQYQEKVDQIMRMMFSEMRNACVVNQINVDFICEMIPHHRGAIAMSEHALRYHICPELKPILQAIISSQKKGVMQMQRLLRCIRC